MTPAPAPPRNPLAARELGVPARAARSAGARRWGRLGAGAAFAASVVAGAPLAAAEAPAPLVIEGGSCPSAAEVRAQLEPLLDDSLRSQLAAAPSERLRVVDYGDRYRIEVGTTVREVADPEHDCAERARISAVFIAMNLALPPAPPPGPVTRAPVPVAAEAEPVVSRGPARSVGRSLVEVGLMAELAVSPDVRVVEPGGRLGLSLRRAPWLYSLGTGVIAPARLELEPRATGDGHVELLRVPTELGVTWARPGRRVEAGPRLALLAAVLVLRGRDLARTETATRLQSGVALGAVLRARAGGRAWAFSTLTAAAYPAAYRLRVEPAGTVGGVPQWWFGFGFGVAWTTGSGPHRGQPAAGAGKGTRPGAASRRGAVEGSPPLDPWKDRDPRLPDRAVRRAPGFARGRAPGAP